MKATSKIIAALVLTVIFTGSLHRLQAQQEGAKYSEVTIAEEFTGIEADGLLKITLVQGPQQLVRFESAEDIEGKAWAEVNGKTLSVGIKNIDPKKVNIIISFVTLEELEVGGAAVITGTSAITADKFDIEASGASRVDLNLKVKNLSTETSGAAELKLSGTADYHRAEVSGAAHMKAYELETGKANVEVSGAAQAKMNVSDELNGETSGIGKIVLKKEPKVKNIEKGGISMVYAEGDTAGQKVTRIEIGGEKVITFDGREMVLDDDSTGSEPVVINDEGVRIVLKETTEDGKKEKKVMIIDEEGVRIIKKESEETETHLVKNKKNKFDAHWAGFELGVNGFVNADNEMTLPDKYEFLDLRMEKSINVKINFFEQNFNLIDNHFGIVTGLGLEYVNYRFDNNVILVADTSTIFGYYGEAPGTDYQKSKLVVNYLNLPVLLEYQTNPRSKSNSFHLQGGLICGLRIGSHSKNVYSDPKENKDKTRDDFYLNPFKFDATAGIGWGILNLRATYSLSTLFKDNKGPEVYPFSIGIMLADF